MLKLQKVYGLIDNIGNRVISGDTTKFFHVAFRKEDGSFEVVRNVKASGPPLAAVAPGMSGTWYIWEGMIIGMRDDDGILREAASDAAMTYWVKMVTFSLLTCFTWVIPAWLIYRAWKDRPTANRLLTLMAA